MGFFIDSEAVAVGRPCRQAWKSHGETRLIACTCLHMDAHGDRAPLLTLKAGRKEGYKVGFTPVPEWQFQLYDVPDCGFGEWAWKNNGRRVRLA